MDGETKCASGTREGGKGEENSSKFMVQKRLRRRGMGTFQAGVGEFVAWEKKLEEKFRSVGELWALEEPAPKVRRGEARAITVRKDDSRVPGGSAVIPSAAL